METKCPQCEYIATEHTTLDNQTNPKNGDIGFCLNCGEFNQFHNKTLMNIDENKVNEETITEMGNIRYAWLQTQAMRRLEETKNG